MDIDRRAVDINKFVGEAGTNKRKEGKKMRFKRFGAAALAMSMTATLFAGCGGNETDSSTAESGAQTNNAEAGTEAAALAADEAIEPCEVEFWHYMTGDLEATLTALTDEFNSTNEYGITVNLVNQGNAPDLLAKLTASAASKTLPDMALAYNRWLSEYLTEVVHLDEFVANDFDNYEDITKSYRDENSEYGFISGLPFNKSSYLYFYNKTLYDELGIEAPKTWEDYYTVGEKLLTEKNMASLGFDDREGCWQTFVRQTGSEYITADGVQYDNEKGLEAATLLVDLYTKGYARLAGDGEYFSALLSNNLIGAYIGSSAGVSYITADGWELGVAPVAAGEKSAACSSGTNLIMFAKETNEQKAVWEYMKYLTSTDVTAKWAIETGYLPVRTSAFEAAEYQEFMKENPAAKAAYEQADVMFFSPVYEGSNEVTTEANTIMEEIAIYNTDKDTSNDIDAQTALDMFVESVNKAMK